MNCKKIEKECPKALELACAYFRYNILTLDNEFSFIIRDLYDFFDEQEVYISVYLESLELKWVWRIHKGLKKELHRVSCNPSVFDTRSEAEEAAFLKAFEILEQNIINQI